MERRCMKKQRVSVPFQKCVSTNCNEIREREKRFVNDENRCGIEYLSRGTYYANLGWSRLIVPIFCVSNLFYTQYDVKYQKPLYLTPFIQKKQHI